MTEPQSRIRGFDGLRALAFLMVFVSHKTSGDLTDRYGVTGVWLFFVLSGFLITRILAQSRLNIEMGQIDYRKALGAFYLRRTLRIFPIYYLYLGVLTILFSFNIIVLDGFWRQLSDWLFLSNFYIEFHDWGVLGHLWSLAVEEQFYLLFAPLALALPRRYLGHLCAALLMVSVTAHVVFIMRGAPTIHLDTNSLTNFGLLAMGGLAGLAADKPIPKWLTSSGAIVLTLLVFLILPDVVSTLRWSQYGHLSGALVVLLLIQVYQNQAGRAVSFLSLAPLRGLGVISYGAYLFHPVIDCSQVLMTMGYSGRGPHAVGVLLDLVLTIVLAMLSWRFFETPLRNLARSNAKPVAPAASDQWPTSTEQAR
jgi:peptidoglycan/LPS O-acetylase OafA/YrhL